ncbi:MAG: lamin tail domain-containing protein [Bacteroidales bacterium]|nr:lamin tail domain-containing protein [Bacteroidales bacterium]
MINLCLIGLMITEIMADPVPSVGLPEAEYIELYNPGPDRINLNGWRILVGDKLRMIDTRGITIVEPDGYVILTASAHCTEMSEYGHVAVIDSWPALRNGGDRITLLDPSGRMRQSLVYSPGIFTDAMKAGGGWSLEMIDTGQYCRSDNWSGSLDPSGGTPGRENSVAAKLPPGDPPRLIRAFLSEHNEIGLLFSTTLDPELWSLSPSCTFYPGRSTGDFVPQITFGLRVLLFSIPVGLNPDYRYRVRLDRPAFNCAGQVVTDNSALFAFPEEPDSGDVVINEVMYDPLPGASEWIELYNYSDRVIEVGDLILGIGDELSEIRNWSDNQDLPFLLFPHSYVILQKQPAVCRSASEIPACRDNSQFFQTVIRPDFMTLPNTGGFLTLMDQHRRVLDRAGYSQDAHDPLLKETKGVSLERLDAGVSGLAAGNWYSSAAGSTPGVKNSVTAWDLNSLPDKEQQEGFYLLDQGSRVVVGYRFSDPGWYGWVGVFNSQGLPVIRLYEEGLLGRSGVLHWEGLDSNRVEVSGGIYLIVAEYASPTGKRGCFKKAVALIRE